MSDIIKKAFEQIHATDQLKEATCLFLYEKIEQKPKHQYKTAFRPIAAFCILLFLCIGSGGWYFWETPVSYVSVDINPSVELSLNRFNRVTDAEGKNEDGILLLHNLSLKGKGYIEAVEILVTSESMQNYLTADAELTFTVASPKAEELLQGLHNSSVSTQYNGTCRSADMESVHGAHACGMSLGKYQEYLHLSEYDDDISPEDCSGMTMGQLRDLLSQYEDIDSNPSDHGHMNGNSKCHGHGKRRRGE